MPFTSGLKTQVRKNSDVILKVRKIWTLSHSSNRSSEVDELELEKLDSS